MQLDKNSDAGWAPCPPGELVQMASGLRLRRRRRVAARAAAALSVVLAIGLASYWSLRGNAPPAPAPSGSLHAGLYCSQVRELLADYRAGKLEPKLQLRVEGHLAECPPCRARLAKLTSQSARPLGPIAAHRHHRPHGVEHAVSLRASAL
jgi:anti-sigma factor RsiW